MTFSSFPFLYASLELPKIIINKGIAASDFPKTVYGVELQQVQYLAILCGIFLLLVLANGAFKYFINLYKGRLGERMLRRFRYQLFSHTLRFPTSHFRRTSQGEVIAMITSEVEPLGGFIGDAVAQPAFQGGTLLTILIFMFAQDIVLGIAAIALYPLQIYLIPKLQRQVNALAKERVRTVRRLAENIGETVSAIEEVHANDTAELHRAHFSRLVGTIYGIRLENLSEEVLHQVSEQLHRPADALLLLRHRRLSGHQGEPDLRRAGCGAFGLQGSLITVEGAAGLVSTEGRHTGEV